MYYDSTETYTLKVPAWTWGGKKKSFFSCSFWNPAFLKRTALYTIIYTLVLYLSAVDKSDYLKKDSQEQKWSDQSHYAFTPHKYVIPSYLFWQEIKITLSFCGKSLLEN